MYRSVHFDIEVNNMLENGFILLAFHKVQFSADVSVFYFDFIVVHIVRTLLPKNVLIKKEKKNLQRSVLIEH